MKRCRHLLKKNSHWIFFALMCLITLYMDVYVAFNVLDGDASWPLVKGSVIAQQRNPFTNDLYFTTEVGLLDQSYLAALFFLFTDNWTAVRLLSALIMQAYYECSFLYLCRQADVKLRNAVYAAGALLVPFSTCYARVVLYHQYYILHIANAFWIIALSLRLLRLDEAPKRKGTVLTAAALAMLWLVCGMNGIRQMMIVGAPMLVLTLIRLLADLRQYRWEEGRIAGPRSLKDEPSARLFGLLVCSFACFLIGFTINSIAILPRYDVANMSATYFTPDAAPERYAQILNGWLVASGIRYSKMALVGVRGLGLAASVVAFGILLLLSAAGCFEKGTLQKRLTHGMLAAAFLTTTLIFLFESIERTFELYYVPVTAMAALVLAQELEKLGERSTSLSRRLLVLMTCCCFLFQGVYTLYFIRVDQQWTDRWSGLGYMEMDTVDQVDDCVEFMQENGYTHAMINYWYANTMIELSDGEIRAVGLEKNYATSHVLSHYRWGSLKSDFDSENLPDTVIAFVKHEESSQFETAIPSAELVYTGSVFSGYQVDAGLVR